jgi:hypothetical protein
MTRTHACVGLAAICLLLPRIASGQGLTGTLIGTVKDEQGGVLPGAVATIESPALIGGPTSVTANDSGQIRFQALPPGQYRLHVALTGFANHREENVTIGAGATIERVIVLTIGGVTETIDVTGGSRIEARGSGFETRFGADYIKAIPGRRYSLFDFIKVAPGISPTSASNGTSNSVTAFGSGVNENAFSSTARTSHVRAVAAPWQNPVATSSRKCKCNRWAPRRSSAISRALLSMSLPGREATGFSRTCRITVSRLV